MDRKGHLSEEQTRKTLIDPILKRAFWDVKGSYVKEEINPVKSKFELKEYKRLGDLKVSDNSLQGDYSKVEPGDCIVAFSRAEPIGRTYGT